MSYAILLFSIIAGSHGYLTVGPENKAVLQGTTVVMKCLAENASEQVLWRRITDEREVPDKISASNQVAPNFTHIYRVNNSLAGQYDLVISALLSTGNQYICQEGPHGLTNGNFKSSELVVFESEPKCSAYIAYSENDTLYTPLVIPVNRSLELRCSVRYSGNWEPTIEWKIPNSTEVVSYVMERTVLCDSVSLTTILTVSIDSVIHGSRYVYELCFNESNRPNSTTAENVPDYHYRWLSPRILMTDSECKVPFKGEDDKIPWFSVILIISVALLLFVILALMFKKLKSKRPKTAPDIIRERENNQPVSSPEFNDQNQAPVYASVQNTKGREKQHKSKNVEIQQERNLGETSNMIGADGTVYAQLQEPAKAANDMRSHPPRTVRHEISDYAMIDHTVAARR